MTEIPPNSPITILLVEDDPGDVLMTREALAESKLLNTLHVLSDGREAIDYLQAAAAGTEPRPDLVLLDLNLPESTGGRCSSTSRAMPSCACIPVVILTTSSAEEDIAWSYDLHANAYVTKPVDFEQFMDVVRKGPTSLFISIVRRAGDPTRPPSGRVDRGLAARVAKSADAEGLNPSGASERAGSNPAPGTRSGDLDEHRRVIGELPAGSVSDHAARQSRIPSAVVDRRVRRHHPWGRRRDAGAVVSGLGIFGKLTRHTGHHTTVGGRDGSHAGGGAARHPHARSRPAHRCHGLSRLDPRRRRGARRDAR